MNPVHPHSFPVTPPSAPSEEQLQLERDKSFIQCAMSGNLAALNAVLLSGVSDLAKEAVLFPNESYDKSSPDDVAWEHPDIVVAIIRSGFTEQILREHCLIKASVKGCVPALQALVEQGVDVNLNYRSKRALSYAAESGQAAAIQFLYHAGATHVVCLQLALKLAASNGHIEATVTLLTIMNVPGNFLLTGVLENAAANGHIPLIDAVVGLGANVNASNCIALSLAAQNGQVEAIQRLVALGTNLKKRACKALEAAARNGHVEALKALVAAGINIHDYSNEIVIAAVMHDKVLVLKALKQWEIDFEPVINRALVLAASVGSAHSIRFCVQHGADVDFDNGRAMRSAAANGHIGSVRALLQSGAAIDAYGEEALFEAARNGHGSIIQTLARAGVDPLAQKDKAMRHAALYGHAAALQILVSLGANVRVLGSKALLDATNQLVLEREARTGDAATKAANIARRADVVRILLQAGANVHARDGLAIEQVVKAGDDSSLREFVKAGGDINGKRSRAYFESDAKESTSFVLLAAGGNLIPGKKV